MIVLLKDRILKTIERLESVDQRKLAQVARVNESSISRYLNGHDELNFESTLRIVQFLFPEEEKEIMVDYIYSQKSRNARHGLEYCVMNHLWEPVDHLLKLLSESSNPVDKEWAVVYEILLIKRRNKLSLTELLEKVENLKPRESEMKVLKRIIKAYIYFDLKEYNSLDLHISGTDILINGLKSDFIKESLRVRLGLILSFVYLYDNKITESREHSTTILNQSFYDRPKGMAYYYFGYSYLFEDYDKTKTYISKALTFFAIQNDKSRIKEAKLTLSFLDSYWKKNKDFTMEFDDYRSFNNYIYYLIQKGDLSLAKEFLDRVHLEELSNASRAFYYYYKGLINEDVSSYYLSIETFLQIHDHFHIQLPLKKLESLGENKIVLNILSSVRGLSYEEDSKISIH